MKKTILTKIILSSLGLFFLSFILSASAEEYCAKKNTNAKMSFSDANSIALKSNECTGVGKLKSFHWCNEISGTWWISLHSNLKHCSPACVINVEDKSVSVNYMCTGLISTRKK